MPAQNRSVRIDHIAVYVGSVFHTKAVVKIAAQSSEWCLLGTVAAGAQRFGM